MTRRLPALLAALALLCAATPPVALANGDPASDVLLQQDYFTPYAPPTDKRLEDALEKVLARADEAGFPLKVAMVMSPQDLGAYPQLFNRPQEYADLLTRNLGPLNPHGDPLKKLRLLVIMPGGYGGNNLGDRVDEALDQVPIQGEAQSDGLAKAAVEATARLAQVNGADVPIPPEANLKLQASNEPIDGGGTSPLVFIAPVLLLFVALGVAGRITAGREAAAEEVGADLEGKPDETPRAD